MRIQLVGAEGLATRTLNRLSARAALTITAIGRHADGGSLYLSIRPDGSRKWVFLYRQRGTSKLREMGLGPAAGANRAGVSLADARRKAATARSLLYDGSDPLTEKRNAKAANVGLTFGEFADQLLDDIELGFRNEKHRAQWRSTLQTYAAPLRPLHLAQIRTDDVLNVLKPIWTTKQETASRVRGRIERVLDAAKAKGLRTGENPARWRGHLSELLAKPDKLKKSNFAAIPFTDMPAFMIKLRSRKSLSALALDFTILCAVRTNETIGATWVEFDLSSNVWVIPAHRMKAEKEHRVPLSDQALEIIRSVKVTENLNSFVFPGLKDNTSLSNMAMLECLRGIVGKGSTVHGFRSSFRDWAGDKTAYPKETIEQALAHRLKDKAEAAYRRSDALEKRRALMTDWARYLACAT